MPEVKAQAIEALFAEHRAFPPTEDFKRQANWNDPAIYDKATKDFEAFWASQAERLDWFTKWNKVLQWDEKTKVARWFDGGTLNVSYNCLDRHVKSGHGKQVAYFWEGEPGDTRTLTFEDMLKETCRLANAPQVARREEGRSGRHLHGHGARAARRAARMLAHRRDPLRRLRRLLGR